MVSHVLPAGIFGVFSFCGNVISLAIFLWFQAPCSTGVLTLCGSFAYVNTVETPRNLFFVHYFLMNNEPPFLKFWPQNK